MDAATEAEIADVDVAAAVAEATVAVDSEASPVDTHGSSTSLSMDDAEEGSVTLSSIMKGEGMDVDTDSSILRSETHGSGDGSNAAHGSSCDVSACVSALVLPALE